MKKNKTLKWKVAESNRVLRTALDKWGDDVGVAFTGRKDSTVVMHMMLQLTKRSPKAMFIDHGLHFDESIIHIKKMIKLWKLDVDIVANKRLLNKLKAVKDVQKKAKIVRELKIQTISDTIKKFGWKAMVTAIRWDENPARSDEKYFRKSGNHYRVHPILHFTEKDVWDYIKKHKIPYNPLYDQGYRSIGEKIFTKKSSKHGDERSGREKGKEEIMDRLRALGYF